VKRSAAERRDAFVALVERHANIAVKVARAYGRSPADHEDLVQEMHAALWRSFERYDPERPFATWMYRVVLNVAISFQRSELRRLNRRVDFDEAAVAAAELHELEPDGRAAQLARYVAGLGDVDKALMLLYLDGYPHREIAATLGLTETNVATKLARLKSRARSALSDGADKAAEGQAHGTR
jgi:RNA polymerase sigma-70 factor (ECF subfamily)